MTNEWNEYKAYIGTPTYAVADKKDTSFLGRFTSDMIKDFSGLTRIFTVLARGYLFHNPDGTLKDGDPYERIDYARRALCAWCSLPSNKKATPTKEWQYSTNFSEYHEEFPELVTADGAGWYYRHVHALAEYIRHNKDSVNKRLHCLSERTKEWDAAWGNKVKQYQVPLFSSNTNAEWLLSFDSAIADALELGALRCEAVTLTAEQIMRLEQFKPKDVPMKVLTTLAEFYIANKQEQSEWVILPVTNIGAYLGSSSLGRQYLSKIPPELMERKQSSFGASVYKIMI